MVKRQSAVRQTWIQSLGWEDPWEKDMAAHSSTLSWKIPWMEEPWGCQQSDTTERLHFHFTQEKHMCLLSNNLKSFIIWKFFLISDFFKIIPQMPEFTIHNPCFLEILRQHAEINSGKMFVSPIKWTVFKYLKKIIKLLVFRNIVFSPPSNLRTLKYYYQNVSD